MFGFYHLLHSQDFLGYAVRYNIPDMLKNGPMSAAQIAAELGKTEALNQIVANHTFSEVKCLENLNNILLLP